MRSVVVTKSLPLPANFGGRQRSLATIRRLAAVGDVTLCGLDEGDADWTGLRQLGATVRSAPRPDTVAAQLRGVAHVRSAAGRFWSADLAHEVRQACAGEAADVLLVDYSHMIPYGRVADARLRVLQLHNVEAELLRGLARSRGRLRGLPARAEAFAMSRLERAGLGSFDIVTVVSDADRERLRPFRDEVVVCPNGCEPRPSLPPAAEPVAAFVAFMGWRPNVDAAVWLARRVWPLAQRNVPGARLLLVGRDPAARVRALAGQGVEVTGTVQEVRPHLAAARVAVAPLLAGGGSRLKILEALEAGRPVVATAVGAEGLEHLAGRGLVVADGVRPFAEALAGLLADPARAAHLGAVGREAVHQEHAWDRTLQPLLDAITGAGP
jgi:glycosyltransferase involved in cell wall biosynthesis